LRESLFRWREFDAYYCRVIPSGSLIKYVEREFMERECIQMEFVAYFCTGVPSGSLYVYVKRVSMETESVFR